MSNRSVRRIGGRIQVNNLEYVICLSFSQFMLVKFRTQLAGGIHIDCGDRKSIRRNRVVVGSIPMIGVLCFYSLIFN